MIMILTINNHLFLTIIVIYNHIAITETINNHIIIINNVIICNHIL